MAGCGELHLWIAAFTMLFNTKLDTREISRNANGILIAENLLLGCVMNVISKNAANGSRMATGASAGFA